MTRRFLNLLLKDRPRILTRLCALFAHRRLSVVSIAVGPEESEAGSSVSFVINAPDHATFSIATKQISRLIQVVKAVEMSADNAHHRCMVVTKVRVPEVDRSRVTDLYRAFGAELLEISPSTMTLQFTGTVGRIEEFLRVLESIADQLDVIRSGTVALPSGGRMLPKAKIRTGLLPVVTLS